MPTKLTYAILFVADMDSSVRFFRDTLGLPLKFQSPFWSEFATGETSLALHPASAQNPAGKIQIGFGVEDLDKFYADLSAQGIVFTQTPQKEAGSLLARFLTPDGVEISVSG